MIRRSITILFVLFSLLGIANEELELDSLEKIVSILKEDTIKSEIYSDLAFKFRNSNPIKAEDYIDKSIDICIALEYKKGLAKSLSIKGVINYLQGNYELALKSIYQAEDIALVINDYRRLSYIYSDIGNVYFFKKEYAKAYEHYTNGLEIAKEHGHTDRAGIIYNNMGAVQNELENYTEALFLYSKSLENNQIAGSKINILYNYTNIGVIYFHLHNYEKALEFLQKAEDGLIEENGLTALGEVYLFKGKIYLDRSEYAEARYNLEKSIETSLAVNNREILKVGYSELSKLFRISEEYQSALEFLDKHLEIKKELDKNGNLLTIISNHEKTQRDKAIKILEHKQLLQTAEIKTKNVTQYIFIFLGIFLLIIIGLGYNRYLVIQKQKRLITIQKENIEKKQKEFKQSLNYARAIQRSILPTAEMMNTQLDGHFVFYKPLHTVSGDFYFFLEKEDRIYISVPDCTGHGVPGAFMSMIGYEILNHIINSMNVKEPNRILARLNDRIFKTLNQGENQGYDGMDLALICIYKEENRMDVSCAGSAVHIYNSKRKDGVFILKNSKFGVGSKFNKDVKYVQESVDLIEGDVIYLFSDGYSDQFGGPKGKKFKISQFKNLLENIYLKDFEEQETILRERFTTWKTHYEQVDDVTVLGFKPKIIAEENKKLSDKHKKEIIETLVHLNKVDLDVDVSGAIEVLESLVIEHIEWKVIKEELTDYVLNMEKEAIIKRISEIIKSI